MQDPTIKNQASFKCDFCLQPWTDDRPMVEGHRGSLVCAHCLTVAYTELADNEAHSTTPGVSCTMCLEERDQPGWQSPINDEALICLRCVKQSATVLEKDEDHHWRRPG